jgi:hypothetical protein
MLLAVSQQFRLLFGLVQCKRTHELSQIIIEMKQFFVKIHSRSLKAMELGSPADEHLAKLQECGESMKKRLSTIS